mmetsp:Transcript_52870/g.172048  ORF Transcript_52870/g.172048 Transcript_52870/m.172048 type:complete len:158 (+) Transcript_52870:199-672(+)
MPAIKRYLGLDLSKLIIWRIKTTTHIIETLQDGHPGREIDFQRYNGYSLPRPLRRQMGTFHMAISFQVIMHILEQSLFLSYMAKLFTASHSYVLVQSDDIPHERVNHMRGWRFTGWIKANATDWLLHSKTLVSKFCPEEHCSRQGDALWLYVHKNHR